MNLASWIILGIIILIVIGVIVYLIRNKGKRCSCCNNNCPNCKKKE